PGCRRRIPGPGSGIEARQRQMRREFPLLLVEAQGEQRIVDGRCQQGERLGRFNTDPEDAWSPLAGEEAQVADGKVERHGADSSQYGFYAFFLVGANLPKEFQSDMHAFGTHPARAGERITIGLYEVGDLTANFWRYVDSDEGSHKKRITT